jgi:endonuclease YncB( thermonuclease family)
LLNRNLEHAGDTIVIETAQGQKERIRLLGIDAPESKQLCQDKAGAPYACGLEAKQSLEKIVGRDPVRCFAAKRDQYSRILGVCYDARSGTELNKELVVEGEAVAYQQYSKAYVADEEGARKLARGVWKGKFDKPWEFRKQKRATAAASAKAAPAAAQGDAFLEE